MTDICADENPKYTEKQIKGKFYHKYISVVFIVIHTINFLLVAVQQKCEA